MQTLPGTACIVVALCGSSLNVNAAPDGDTDKDGVVWLSGTARTQKAVNNAVAIARATEEVRSVQMRAQRQHVRISWFGHCVKSSGHLSRESRAFDPEADLSVLVP